MNKDIRLLISFRDHRKRKRLENILGAEGVLALIDLWLMVAQDRPDGILTDWDEEDIYNASAFRGACDEFINAMIKCGFLKKNKKEIFVIKNWNEHQGWACGAKQRSEAARKAAKTRWKKPTSGRNAGSNAKAMREHQDRNAPSPSPSPSLKTNNSASGSSLIKKKIIEKCDQVARLPQKDKFNPYQFANAQIKDGYHPDIVFIALCGIQDSWDTIARPWGWGTSILKTKQQMYNEKKHVQESQKFKEMWSIDPRIKKLISDIGG